MSKECKKRKENVATRTRATGPRRALLSREGGRWLASADGRRGPFWGLMTASPTASPTVRKHGPPPLQHEVPCTPLVCLISGDSLTGKAGGFYLPPFSGMVTHGGGVVFIRKRILIKPSTSAAQWSLRSKLGWLGRALPTLGGTQGPGRAAARMLSSEGLRAAPLGFWGCRSKGKWGVGRSGGRSGTAGD